MSETETAPAVTLTLTDPAPLKRDTRCPRCREAATARVISAGFGRPHEVCGKCGWDFPREEEDGV